MSQPTVRPSASRATTLALALTAFFGLTGAKGGCFGEVITSEPLDCEVGYQAIEVCASPLLYCAEGADCVEAQPVCEQQCVPVGPCEPGFHLETVCEAVAVGVPTCIDPIPTCVDQCVPDSPCEPGFHVERVCEPVAVDAPHECQPTLGSPLPDCGPPTPACFDQCVPDVPVCPPGHREESVCETLCDPDSDAPCWTDCRATCVPEGCAPGTHEEWVCNDVGCPEGEACTTDCYPVCVADDDCGHPEPEPQPEPYGKD